MRAEGALAFGGRAEDARGTGIVGKLLGGGFRDADGVGGSSVVGDVGEVGSGCFEASSTKVLEVEVEAVVLLVLLVVLGGGFVVVVQGLWGLLAVEVAEVVGVLAIAVVAVGGGDSSSLAVVWSALRIGLPLLPIVLVVVAVAAAAVIVVERESLSESPSSLGSPPSPGCSLLGTGTSAVDNNCGGDDALEAPRALS